MLKSQIYLPYFEMVLTTKKLSPLGKQRVKDYLVEVAEECQRRINGCLIQEEHINMKIEQYPEYIRMLPDTKKIIDRLEERKLRQSSTNKFFSDMLVTVTTFEDFEDFDDLDKVVKLPCFRF